MPRPQKLSQEEVQIALETLNSWSLDQGKLYREFKFNDFAQAFAFMSKVAPVAEEMDHHPEWFNVYSTLRVHLTTHDAGGITQLDLDLARRMNRIQAEI
ncbi:MAG: 4a-hydroxytetrahydrobiopterin dehydratase [Planctomycetota bacterium]|jgi:4a-hydroxytetrahydrobiopterin dehydratase